jgi:hypothetical protein
MTKRMLDLFSGFKGASQAFAAHPEWEVVTVDNNPDLEPDLVLDLSDPSQLEVLSEHGPFDLIWASPPCIEFYKCLAPWFDEYGTPPDMGLVRSAVAIMDHLDPAVRVLENTHSGNQFIRHVLGRHRQKIGPFYLWGNFPLIHAEIQPGHKARRDVWSDNPMRSNILAEIPLSISEGLLDAIHNQHTLF